MATVTVQMMRDYIKRHSSDQFAKKVDKMPDNQVIAIYHRYIRRNG